MAACNRPYSAVHVSCTSHLVCCNKTPVPVNLYVTLEVLNVNCTVLAQVIVSKMLQLTRAFFISLFQKPCHSC